MVPGGQTVVDRADVTSVDREYFEQNPDSDEYERDALPVELDQARSYSGQEWTGARAAVRPGFSNSGIWIAE